LTTKKFSRANHYSSRLYPILQKIMSARVESAKLAAIKAWRDAFDEEDRALANQNAQIGVLYCKTSAELKKCLERAKSNVDDVYQRSLGNAAKNADPEMLKQARIALATSIEQQGNEMTQRNVQCITNHINNKRNDIMGALGVGVVQLGSQALPKSAAAKALEPFLLTFEQSLSEERKRYGDIQAVALMIGHLTSDAKGALLNIKLIFLLLIIPVIRSSSPPPQLRTSTTHLHFHSVSYH
jgi:hypothetical protein